MDINVEKELNVIEIPKEKEKNTFTVKLPEDYEFVQFSFSAKDSFSRFEAVKEAQDILKNAITKTGGNMSTDLMEAYEGLNVVMEKIKALYHHIPLSEMLFIIQFVLVFLGGMKN